MKTAQQILDEGIAFILGQTEPCQVPDTGYVGKRCAYINDSEQRCVAGNFMSEELCKVVEEQKEGGSVNDVVEWIEDESFDGEFQEDYAVLKPNVGLHDGWTDRTEPAPDFHVDALTAFADQDGLVMPKHERLGNLP